MAETKIPNSEDLFEIYKSQLELVDDIVWVGEDLVNIFGCEYPG